MPSAVWLECLPNPTVPVPMARRLVLMPVPPRVTVSVAAYLRGSCVSARAFRMDWRVSQRAPTPAAVVAMNSLRFMGYTSQQTLADSLDVQIQDGGAFG